MKTNLLNQKTIIIPEILIRSLTFIYEAYYQALGCYLPENLTQSQYQLLTELAYYYRNHKNRFENKNFTDLPPFKSPCNKQQYVFSDQLLEYLVKQENLIFLLTEILPQELKKNDEQLYTKYNNKLKEVSTFLNMDDQIEPSKYTCCLIY